MKFKKYYDKMKVLEVYEQQLRLHNIDSEIKKGEFISTNKYFQFIFDRYKKLEEELEELKNKDI